MQTPAVAQMQTAAVQTPAVARATVGVQTDMPIKMSDGVALLVEAGFRGER